MMESMRHDPAYVHGVAEFPQLGAYVGWIAHSGSFAHAQNETNRGPQQALLLAGECYASQVMPTAATRQGSVDAQCSDGLLSDYSGEIESFIHSLNGQFSGVLVDAHRRQVWLFIDRFGMERIYFASRGDAFYFATEAKALLAVLPECRAIDDGGLAEVLTYGSNRRDRTLFRGVLRMPAGNIWELGGSRRKVQYFQSKVWEDQEVLSAEVFSKAFREAFGRALPAYVESDRRVGLSLTGGLDTRMILACASKLQRRPVCYTYVGLESLTLDARIGARIAAECGLEHHALRLDPSFISGYGRHLDRTVHITDGCAGALGAHELFFSAQARQLSAVRVTGNFGSELLRGMSTLKPLGLDSALFNADFLAFMQTRTIAEQDEPAHPVSHAAFSEIPSHLYGTWCVAKSQLTVRAPFMDNELVRVAYQAPPSARASSAAALDLISHYAPGLARIPTDRGHAVGRASVSEFAQRLFCAVTFKLDYFDKEGLPDRLLWLAPMLGALPSGLLGLHKYLPYRRWFQRELAATVKERCEALGALGLPYLNADAVRQLGYAHERGERNLIREIGAMLTLEAIVRLLLGTVQTPRNSTATWVTA
jgi:asparagine synthase (glutamine-hydrolysing)